MKKFFTKWLPFVAAVLLATACSKDDNINNNNNYVIVPFSIKVDDGTSLSKIAYSEEYGKYGKVVTRTFEPDDVGIISLYVTGIGIKSTDLPLKKSNIGGKDIYYFEGDIEVADDMLQAFKDGGIIMTGSFSIGPNGTYITYSTTSLEHLMKNCIHEYQWTFTSNTDHILFKDQNAYLSITRKNSENKTVNINEQDYTFNPDGKIWIAVDGGAKITSKHLGINAKTAEAGHIYNINRVAATSITLDKTSLTLSNNMSYSRLTATVEPENCSVKDVVWSTSDKDGIIELYENGDLYVYGVKNGTAIITATAADGSGVTATCEVTVTVTSD